MEKGGQGQGPQVLSAATCVRCSPLLDPGELPAAGSLRHEVTVCLCVNNSVQMSTLNLDLIQSPPIIKS